MRLSLLYIAHKGAGPVYSLEMAKALAQRKDCELQIIISNDVSNIESWNAVFANSSVDYNVVKTYSDNYVSVFLNSLNIVRQERIVRLVRRFQADVLYLPFGLLWSRYVLGRLHNKVKIVSTVHDVAFHDSLMNLGFKELASYVFNYGSSRYEDGIIILNKKDKPLIEERTKKKVAVIPHASFNYYFDDNRPIDTSLKKKIGFLGRIEPYKGLDLLIDAFEKLHINGLKLIIAGGGNIDSDLLFRINANSNIDLVNRYIEDSEFQGLLDSVDFTVLPYVRASQSGVIPLCFAARKTVVVTDVGALCEQVPEGTGVVVEPDSDCIAQAITFLYENPTNIESMSKNAKEYADKELSWGHSAELLLRFCKSII